MFFEALKMAQPYDCGKKMLQNGQNYRRGFQIIFPFTQYGELVN